MAAGTSFDTEKLTADAEAIANDRLKGMGIGATAPVERTDIPAQATLHAPHGGTAPPETPPQTERKTRTTVAKLAQRYQERIETLNDNILQSERIIQAHQIELQQLRCSLEVWTQAFAEITE